jgi:hypothetical protein
VAVSLIIVKFSPLLRLYLLLIFFECMKLILLSFLLLILNSATICSPETLTYQKNLGLDIFFGGADKLAVNDSQASWPILSYGGLPDMNPGPYMPMWQLSPFNPGFFMLNYFVLNNKSHVPIDTRKAVTMQFYNLTPGDINSGVTTAYFAGLLSTKAGSSVYYEGDPISNIQLPVAKSFDDNMTVAVISVTIHWASYFDDILPLNAKDITVVIDDPCSQPSTLVVRGNNVIFVGKGDHHETRFNQYVTNSSWNTLDVIQDGTVSGLPYLSSYCPPSIMIYPTTTYTEQFNTKQPVYMTLTVALVFVFAISVFIAYDRLVERRQKIVLTKALRSTAIVTSLFPQNIAERLMQQQATDEKNRKTMNNNQRLRSFVANGENNLDISSAPIADLFPNATVFFADIAGFTAWSR